MEAPFPRGSIPGRQVDGPRWSEAEHVRKCPLCRGDIDMRDRAWIDNHQQPLRHPAQDRAQ